jgi:hypothetical protein
MTRCGCSKVLSYFLMQLFVFLSLLLLINSVTHESGSEYLPSTVTVTASFVEGRSLFASSVGCTLVGAL